MHALPAIFALLVAAVGWYYLFYSKASDRLSSIEEDRANRLRGLLRRINAILMLIMAVGIAVAMYKLDRDETYQLFVLTWMGILLLLVVVMILGLIDVRLTWKLRRTLRERNRS